MRFSWLGLASALACATSVNAATVTRHVLEGDFSVSGPGLVQFAAQPMMTYVVLVELERPLVSYLSGYYDITYDMYDSDGAWIGGNSLFFDDYRAHSGEARYYETFHFGDASVTRVDQNTGETTYFRNANHAITLSAWDDTHYRLTIDAYAGVPEPGAWAMLIAGFGLAGGALRSRRQPRTARA